jgi:hypothetical protein
MATGFMEIPPSHAVALFKQCHLLTNCLNCARPLVAKGHILLLVVYIGATETAMSDLDEHFPGSNLAVRGCFMDTFFPTLEDGEVDHCEKILLGVGVACVVTGAGRLLLRLDVPTVLFLVVQILD